jgi:hypothetical protein
MCWAKQLPAVAMTSAGRSRRRQSPMEAMPSAPGSATAVFQKARAGRSA